MEKVRDRRRTLFEALKRVPTSLCHGDFVYGNLFDRAAPDGGRETAVIDWQYSGLRQIGGDIAALIADCSTSGDESPEARFTNRVRKGNWTQIFAAAIRVSGSDLAVRKLSVGDELDYQKQERLRELLRDLESTVINGVAPESTRRPRLNEGAGSRAPVTALVRRRNS